MSEEKLLEVIGNVVEKNMEKLEVKIDGNFEKLETRMDEKLEKLEARMDKKMDDKLEKLETKMDEKFREVNHNLALVITEQNNMRDEMRAEIKEIKEHQIKTDKKLDNFIKKVEVKHKEFDYRISALEVKSEVG